MPEGELRVKEFKVYFFDESGDSHIERVRAVDYIEARRIIRKKYVGCDITHVDLV